MAKTIFEKNTTKVFFMLNRSVSIFLFSLSLLLLLHYESLVKMKASSLLTWVTSCYLLNKKQEIKLIKWVPTSRYWLLKLTSTILHRMLSRKPRAPSFPLHWLWCSPRSRVFLRTYFNNFFLPFCCDSHVDFLCCFNRLPIDPNCQVTRLLSPLKRFASDSDIDFVRDAFVVIPSNNTLASNSTNNTDNRGSYFNGCAYGFLGSQCDIRKSFFLLY